MDYKSDVVYNLPVNQSDSLGEVIDIIIEDHVKMESSMGVF